MGYYLLMGIVLAIDWGSKIIGLAKASLKDKIIFPLGFMPNDGNLYFSLAGIISQEKISQIVVGMPNKEIFIQDKIKSFVGKLSVIVDLPIDFIGEDYTSVEAGNLLSAIQSEQQAYSKTYAKDTVAAMKILERWILSAESL